jgi:hypothetical protein
MPIKQNGYSQNKLNAKRNRKRKEADIRNGKYEVLSVKDKLASLPVDGAKRQRAKLNALLVKESEAVKVKKEKAVKQAA